MIYCLDTNVFIQAWNGYYARDFFPDYWDSLDQLAQKGIVFATEEVKKEIEDIDDAVQKCLVEVFKDPNHHRLVDSVKGRSKADPWVIAHAMAEGAIVVTKEGYAPPETPRIKIPNVCDDLGIEWINDYALIRQLGWSFSINNKK